MADEEDNVKLDEELKETELEDANCEELDACALDDNTAELELEACALDGNTTELELDACALDANATELELEAWALDGKTPTLELETEEPEACTEEELSSAFCAFEPESSHEHKAKAHSPKANHLEKSIVLSY